MDRKGLGWIFPGGHWNVRMARGTGTHVEAAQ